MARFIVKLTREGDWGVLDAVTRKWAGWSASIVKARTIAKRLNSEAKQP